ncbi:hypothetical protein HDU97_009282 [Phlyctochytrium planicorne]|nr:hypothetical protein HDU97_009282 [Phlyctochytrium planicorne]
MKVTFNLFLASLISLAVSAFAAPSFDFIYGDADVHVVSTSHSERFIYGYNGYVLSDWNVTVQLAVKDLAFKKVVGIRYTNDSWVSYSEAFAFFTSKIDSTYELWTLTIQRGAHSNQEPRPEYIVAGFASYDQAARVWDPRNDYYVYDRATQQQPALLLNGLQGTTVSFDADAKKVVLAGSVRTYAPSRATINKPGNVLVRWTVDNWKTFQDTPAMPKAFDLWDFKFPVANADLTLSPNVQFAIQFKNSETSSFWLNNDSNNYAKNLQPTIYTNFEKTPTFTGIVPLYLSTFSDLNIGSFKVRVDGSEWKEFTPGPYATGYYVQTNLISNGKHNMDIVVSLKDGPEIFSVAYPFIVDNHISFKGQWTPKPPASLPTEALSSWTATARNGKVYFGFGAASAARYSSFGSTDAPEVVYTAKSGNYDTAQKLAVDATSVYMLNRGNRVFKFDEKTGALDTAFASNGTLVVDSTVVLDGKNICYPSDLTVVGENLFVSDSCNGRILKFTLSGKFVSARQYKSDVLTLVISSTPSTLITTLYSYPVLTIQETNPVDFSVISSNTYEIGGAVDSILKLSDGTYAVIFQGSNLIYLKDGKTVASFRGMGSTLMPGSFSIGKALSVLDDDSIFLVSVEGASLQKFDVKLN